MFLVGQYRNAPVGAKTLPQEFDVEVQRASGVRPGWRSLASIIGARVRAEIGSRLVGFQRLWWDRNALLNKTHRLSTTECNVIVECLVVWCCH